MKTHFSSDWKNWIAINVHAGRDLDGIFKILLDEGYAYAAIVKEMNYQPGKPIDELINPFSGRKQQSKQVLDNSGLAIAKGKIILPNALRIDSPNIDLRVIPNFLSKAECKKIITLIKLKLRPSEVSNAEVNSHYRNSRTCDLGRLNDDFVERIDIRICQLMGVHRAYSEVLEGQYYDVGQEFKAHTDYFEKSEFTANCHEFGQRTYTVMVYLNEVEKGGETCFLHAEKTFKPTAGTAVIWNNLNPDGTPNSYTLHQSNLVEQGCKAIITKWFRTKPASGYEYIKMFTKDVNQFD